jgi:hypothetical protein
MMADRHEGIVELSQEFDAVHRWLCIQGQVELFTRIGTRFSARANLTTSGPHRSESVVLSAHGVTHSRPVAQIGFVEFFVKNTVQRPKMGLAFIRFFNKDISQGTGNRVGQQAVDKGQSSLRHAFLPKCCISNFFLKFSLMSGNG